jgi:hypothetical protein
VDSMDLEEEDSDDAKLSSAQTPDAVPVVAPAGTTLV